MFWFLWSCPAQIVERGRGLGFNSHWMIGFLPVVLSSELLEHGRGWGFDSHWAKTAHAKNVRTTLCFSFCLHLRYKRMKNWQLVFFHASISIFLTSVNPTLPSLHIPGVGFLPLMNKVKISGPTSYYWALITSIYFPKKQHVKWHSIADGPGAVGQATHTSGYDHAWVF